MRIIVEIGANNGDDSVGLLNGADQLYVCEPDPTLFAGLVKRFAHEPRVTLWPWAVDQVDAVRTFNIMEHERGINSLYALHPNLLNTPLQKHWQYQKGMTNQITVHTIPLATLLALYNIPHIDFLWIDAQGNDLNVLKSLGDRIADVREGRCEVTYKVPIYEGVDNSYESVTKFLESKGFDHVIDYVHQDDSEVDVKFFRREE